MYAGIDLFRPLSGRFDFSYGQKYFSDLSWSKSFYLEGAVGRTWRPYYDLDLFVLFGGGLVGRTRDYVYCAPELGLIFRQIWRMKTIVIWSFPYFPVANESLQQHVQFTHTINWDKFAITMAGNWRLKDKKSDGDFRLLGKYFF